MKDIDRILSIRDWLKTKAGTLKKKRKKEKRKKRKKRRKKVI